jgi:hypothetical protein
MSSGHQRLTGTVLAHAEVQMPLVGLIGSDRCIQRGKKEDSVWHLLLLNSCADIVGGRVLAVHHVRNTATSIAVARPLRRRVSAWLRDIGTRGSERP